MRPRLCTHNNIQAQYKNSVSTVLVQYGYSATVTTLAVSYACTSVLTGSVLYMYRRCIVPVLYNYYKITITVVHRKIAKSTRNLNVHLCPAQLYVHYRSATCTAIGLQQYCMCTTCGLALYCTRTESVLPVYCRGTVCELYVCKLLYLQSP